MDFLKYWVSAFVGGGLLAGTAVELFDSQTAGHEGFSYTHVPLNELLQNPEQYAGETIFTSGYASFNGDSRDKGPVVNPNSGKIQQGNIVTFDYALFPRPNMNVNTSNGGLYFFIPINSLKDKKRGYDAYDPEREFPDLPSYDGKRVLIEGTLEKEFMPIDHHPNWSFAVSKIKVLKNR